jgi:hypothetical protein
VPAVQTSAGSVFYEEHGAGSPVVLLQPRCMTTMTSTRSRLDWRPSDAA